MAEEVGQEIKDVLVSAEDENGEERTILLPTNGELNYIPERIVMAGRNRSNNEKYKIKCGTDGALIF